LRCTATGTGESAAPAVGLWASKRHARSAEPAPPAQAPPSDLFARAASAQEEAQLAEESEESQQLAYLVLQFPASRAAFSRLLRTRNTSSLGLAAALEALPATARGMELIVNHPLYAKSPEEAESDIAVLMGALAAAIYEYGFFRDDAAKRAVLGCVRASGAEGSAVAQDQALTAGRAAFAAPPSAVESVSAAPPPPAAAAGYRWSRTEVGQEAVNVFSSPRAVAQEAAAPPRRDAGWPLDEDTAPLPPPPPFFDMRSASASATSPLAAVAVAPPAAKKGFGSAARAGRVSAPAPAAAPSRADDSAALAAAERCWAAVAAWHARLPSAPRRYVVSARQLYVTGGPPAEPALTDWLPLVELLLVDGAQCAGRDPIAPGLPSVAARFDGDVAAVAHAALRARLATPGSRKLPPSALEWAVESLASYDAASSAARGTAPPLYTAGDGKEMTAITAAATLGVPLDAPRAAVRAAYRKLAAAYHPDVAPSGQSEAEASSADARFAAVRAAYELLTQREATGARSAGIASRAATGYAAWAAGRRDWETLEDAVAAAGVVPACRIAARPLAEEATLFFANRNRALSAQQRKRGAGT
jgi:hypothetical protein